MMEERLSYMVGNRIYGQSNKDYKKNSEEEFRSYFFDILKENKLSSEMQKKIVEEVELTPRFQINTKMNYLWCRNGSSANSNYA
jgi:peptidyl-prolyl cis-trans isomerase SurA